MPHVRLASVDDAPLLARMGANLFVQAVGAKNRPADLRAYVEEAFSESRQARELADPQMRTWIAEDDRREPIGYAQIRLGAGPASIVLERPSELARIYADARWHGQGVGRDLLDRVVAAASDWSSTHLWLSVWKQNPRGIAFYEKHGFRIAGETTFQLGSDTQGDWIMLRALRPVPA
jgi:GNAT superfamily N-acetyltransferase